MKKLVVLPILLILFLPGVLAVFTNGYFEGNSSLSELTIQEGESTQFTAVAFSIDPPVHGQVFIIKDDLSYSHLFRDYIANNGTYGSYFEMFDVDYETYNNSCGDFTITVQGYDDSGSHYTDINLFVECNTAPSLNLLNATIDEDSGLNEDLISLELYASDSEDDATDLTFEILSQSDETIVTCAIDLNNNLDCTPKADMHGFSDVEIKVIDSLGLSGLGTTRINVNNVNDAPTMDAIDDITIDESATATITATGHDIDPDETLAYSINDSRFSQDNNVFTWQTGYEDSGVHTVLVSVNDGEETVSQEVTVTVNDVNRVPVMDAIGDKTVDENSLLEFTVTANDPDGDSLSFSASTIPEGATFNSQTQIFSWTPGYDLAGSYNVTFTVSDGEFEDSETIIITVNNVNRAPVLDSIGPLTATEGELFYFDINATDPDSDAITFSDDSDLFDIDTSTGEISFTPSQTSAGNYLITISVSDGVLSDSELVNLTITQANLPPTVEITNPSNNSMLTEGVQTAFIAYAIDPDEDELYYLWDFGDGTTSTSSNTEHSYNEPGTYSVSVNVSDEEFSATDSISITVLAHQYNITNLKSYSDDQFSREETVFYRNESLYLNFNVIDKDDGSLTTNNINQVYMYNNQTGQEDIEFDAFNGSVGAINIINGQPETPNGSYYYYLKNIPLTDEQLGWNIVFVFSYDGNSSGQTTLPIEVLNNEIVLEDIPDVTFNEDESDSNIDLDDYVSDVETSDEDIVWTYSGNTNININIDANTNIVTFTANENWNGQETITFTADDTDGSTASDDVTVTVVSVSDAPVVSSIHNVTFNEDESDSSIDLDDYVDDPDNTDDEITWTYSGNTNININIDANTNIVTFTANENWNGQETITFIATDPDNKTGTDDMTITVSPVNDAPIANDDTATTTENTPVTINVLDNDEDPDNDTITLTNLTQPTNGVTEIDLEVITYTPNNGFNGTDTFTYTLSDGSLTDTATVTITITPVNVAPVIDSYSPETDVEMDRGNTQLFSVSASDVDGDELSYSWQIDGDSVSSNQDYSFYASEEGTYELVVTVNDSELTDSHSWTITVLDASLYGNFTGNTTDFNILENPEAATDITFENNFGGIYFGNEVLNLSRLMQNLSVISGAVIITENIIGIDTDVLPDFTNHEANIVMQDVPNNFMIYFSDTFTTNPDEITTPCPSSRCYNLNHNERTGTVSFSVAHFSVYKVGAAPAKKKTEKADIQIRKAKAANHLIKAGEYLDLMISLFNKGEETARNVKTTVIIADLGIKESFSSFDLKAGKRRTKMAYIKIPADTKPGEYYIRVSAFGSNDHNAKYIPIMVY